MKPVLLVIAGPNGSGKTTVTERLRVERWSEGVESVLSTDAKVDFVRRARQVGYFVRVFFIGTSDPRINAATLQMARTLASVLAPSLVCSARSTACCRSGSMTV